MTLLLIVWPLHVFPELQPQLLLLQLLPVYVSLLFGSLPVVPVKPVHLAIVTIDHTFSILAVSKSSFSMMR